MIETVRGIAEQLGYDEARFEATTIAAYEGDGPVDLLVSLHACDTATDEAIAAGVRLGAEAIVVAPCCHHELAAQIAATDEGRRSCATACCSAGRPISSPTRCAPRRSRRSATAST